MLSVVQVRGLGKRDLTELVTGARRLGLTPGVYAKRLLEETLDVARAAQSKTFAQLTGEGRVVDEAELDAIIDKAQRQHQLKNQKKR